jgi:hypothetical protein
MAIQQAIRAKRENPQATLVSHLGSGFGTDNPVVFNAPRVQHGLLRVKQFRSQNFSLIRRFPHGNTGMSCGAAQSTDTGKARREASAWWM